MRTRLVRIGLVRTSFTRTSFMRIRMILLLSMVSSGLAAENLEKTQKKELEAQVKTMTAEAQSLERSGRLAEARIKYAESQALIEMKDVTDALKHLDEEIQKRVKNALNDSRKLYEAHKFREAALALDEAMKLQAFQPVLAYNLALCYHQLGERDKALEYLGKARSGTADPKQKQKLMQMVSFFTTGESGLSLNEADKDRVTRVNRLADSIGLEASLQDDAGEDEAGEEAALADAARCLRLRRAGRFSPLMRIRPAVRIAIPAQATDRACAMR